MIEVVTWETYAASLKAVREEVFIKEQHVPIELEWDSMDETALHLLAFNDAGEAIGCARLISGGVMGRMAVLKPWRGLGVGRALLARAFLLYAQQSIKIITLSAQLHAIPFYEKAGFKTCSQPYLDAGIMHVDMQLSLKPQNKT